MNIALIFLQVSWPDSYNESLLEMLSIQQGNQRRNHHVAEKGNAGVVSFHLLIYLVLKAQQYMCILYLLEYSISRIFNGTLKNNCTYN